jgi:hypothetical protein
VFTIAEHGKPALDTRVHGDDAIVFNLGHCATLAALAVARVGEPIGSLQTLLFPPAR